MLLIQQSSSFRTWTSRALMVYFRRALLFLVVSPRQNINNNRCILQQQTVYFSDAEDDEEILMIEKKKIIFNQTNSNKLSQGLNNSMTKSIQKEITYSPLIKSSKVSLISIDQSSPIFNSNQAFRSFSITKIYQTNPLLSCPPPPCICNSFSSESNKLLLPTSHRYSSTSIHENSSVSSDDIYEKYQTSFSHILHQTKSLHTLRIEDKLESMLVLEPNTSIITVHQLTYPWSSHSMITTHICVRLIANRIDSSIQCDTKPIGCKKSLLNNKKQSSSISSNKKFERSSIL
jgi:hypothetical protein